MFGIREQAALMRLGLRFISHFGIMGNWIGKLPTEEDIDEWQTTRLKAEVEDYLLKNYRRKKPRNRGA